MADADPVRMSQTRSAGRKLGLDNVDDLGRAMLLLATEIAVLSDRQRILEAVLEERGIDVADAIANYRPGGAVAATLAADRARLAKAIVETLCPPEA